MQFFNTPFKHFTHHKQNCLRVLKKKEEKSDDDVYKN